VLVIKLVVGGGGGNGDNVGGFGGILGIVLLLLVVLVGGLTVGWAVAVGVGGGDGG